MSMSHKAFVFDAAAFERELRAILAQALAAGDVAPLRAFIEANRAALSSPDAGTELDDDWEAQIEFPDAERYGDLALTKYYDPNADIGLGDDWLATSELLAARGLGEALTLGTPLPGFDPGKQGSYFQSPAQVSANLRALGELLGREPALASDLAPLRAMLDEGRDAGLYVTF